MTDNKKEFNKQIQVLRGLFCVLLVIYHYTCRYSQLYGSPNFYSNLFAVLGDISLSAFLVISGFFFINPGKKCNGRSFLYSKIKRLYPDYLIAITIIFIVTNLFGNLGDARDVSVSQFLLNIPMINVVLGIGYVDGAHWYITFLIIMAVYVFILQLLGIDRSERYWTINLVLIVIYALLVKTNVFVFLVSFKQYMRYYLMFSSGIYLRLLFYKERQRKQQGFMFLLGMYIISIFLLDGALVCAYMVMVPVVVTLAAERKIALVEKIPFGVTIGNESYMIYLIHQNIGYCIINYVTANFNTIPVVAVSIAFIAVVGLSFLISYIKKEIINASTIS